MNPFRRRLNSRKTFFPQVLPYCILIFVILAVALIRDGLNSTKTNSHLSEFENQASPDFTHLTGAVHYYYEVFQRLKAEGYLLPSSKALCVESISGHDVMALKSVGVNDAIGISEAALRASDQGLNHLFDNNTFDFEFFGYSSWFDWSVHPSETAAQICRTLNVGGYLVVHISVKDVYTYNSFIKLFTCCSLEASRDIKVHEFATDSLHEVILKKDNEYSSHTGSYECKVPMYRRKLIKNLEPLVMEEPVDSWSWDGLGKNANGIQYLSGMVDLSFKQRYIYVDLGSRNYDSSIGSWFEKQYPKQNKKFEIYAFEADKSFYKEYTSEKGVTLMPYAAWVRNETLFFEIDREPTDVGLQWGQMGRIQPEQSSNEHKDYVDNLYKVEALDLADWLIRSFSQRDFLVMKMDIEGAEVNMVKRLVESGAICLIDELFLECHYDRFLKCCSGEKTNRHKRTYAQCAKLFAKLREDGCAVHQWW
ncbi:hypothetical protein ACH5RR_041031 [Cinchona calisaya]|uniref:DUF7870 domain-containing protein n=1 Tax=Cinchona calisaya TaxID=153742 RepID=A0ABD2XSU5_9GENT